MHSKIEGIVYNVEVVVPLEAHIFVVVIFSVDFYI